MLITHADLFTPQNLEWRVFTKVPRSGLSERLAFIADNAGAELEVAGRYGELGAGAFDLSPVAQIVVDRSGFVTEVNESARSLFEIGPAEVGRPLQDLELSYRPADLRSALEEAYGERRSVTIGRVAWTARDAEARVLEVVVAPVPGPGPGARGASRSMT